MAGEGVCSLRLSWKWLPGRELGKYKIHDWQEHNPWAATRGMRVECAKKAAAIRWQNRSDAERMPVASEPDAERMPPLQKAMPPPNQPNPKPLRRT